MPRLNLADALSRCPAAEGITPSRMADFIEQLAAKDTKEIAVQLDCGFTMPFWVHQDNGKTILTAKKSLTSFCGFGIPLESLPEILSKLEAEGISTDAIQFSHAFNVKGRFSGTVYRSHFNHILLYKDAHSGKYNGVIIDSTINPFGVYNPLSWLASNSILSGEELLEVRLTRLLTTTEAQNALVKLGNLKSKDDVVVASLITTNKQPNSGDRRCSIYVLSAMDTVIDAVISKDSLSKESLTALAVSAHQKLNEPEMMKISFSETTLNIIK